MSYPLLTIAKGKEHSIQRKHPWVFSGALASDTSELQDGDLVCLTTKKQQILGIGHYQHATIAVRILSFDYETIDEAFYERRLSNAYQLRLRIGLLNPNNNIFRLCHGEGDLLPGLIIDFYNGVAVIQCHSFGMYRQVELIAQALQKVIGSELKAIYHKSSDTLAKREVATEGATDGYLFGEVAVPHLAQENGVQYQIDWINGQKTGFFIDQRENRALLGKYAQGKKVLNTFCYSGGFSLQALQHGAMLVHSLDSSKKAIALTDANVVLNQFEDRHGSIVDDAMDYMKNLPEDYDIIVLDPPAFAKHRDKRHQSFFGYMRINADAIREI
jgi:23S rRNA (cytosine1962-C5)-methyltransferase